MNYLYIALAIFLVVGGLINFGNMPGKTEKPPIVPAVAGLGDSTLWGCVGDGRLAVPPCQRIKELAAGRFVIHDYSFGGCTSAAALEGRAHFPPLVPFSDWIKTIADPFVLIKYGGADGFLEDRGLAQDDQLAAFKGRMQTLITLTQQSGKTPILVTSVRPATPLMQFLPRYDAIVRQLAAERELKLIDVSANVEFSGLSDICIDEIHAGQAYSDRIAAYMAKELDLIINA
jgi:hypothetical protein